MVTKTENTWTIDKLLGADRDTVVQVQQELSAAGLYAVKGSKYYGDGDVGMMTSHALNLKNDSGYAERYLNNLLQHGQPHNKRDLMMMQAALNSLGLGAGDVDGAYGNKTDAAYRRYMHAHPNLGRDNATPTPTVASSNPVASGEHTEKSEAQPKTREAFSRHALPGVSHTPGQEVIYLGDSRAQAIHDADRSGHRVDGAKVGEQLLHRSAEGQSAYDRAMSRISPGDKVLMSFGTNDFRGWVGEDGKVTNPALRDKFVREYREQIDEVKARGGHPVILGFSATGYSTLSQAQVNYLNGEGNAMLRQIARAEGTDFMATTRNDVSGRDIHNNATFNKGAAQHLQQMHV